MGSEDESTKNLDLSTKYKEKHKVFSQNSTSCDLLFLCLGIAKREQKHISLALVESQLGAYMGRVGLGWGDFSTQPTIVG